MRVRGKGCQVVLWQHCYDGKATEIIGEGDYDQGQLEARGMYNDQVSSLKVWKEDGMPEYGSDGCWVAIYEHHWEHGGWEAIFDEGEYNCDTFERHD